MKKIISIIIYLYCISGIVAQPTAPIPCGHAHNDYAKSRPSLTAALEAGMTSIEIDVYAQPRRLAVAHFFPNTLFAKNIKTCYFDKINRWLSTYQYFYTDTLQTLTLMIDIKSHPQRAYEQLRTICIEHEDLLTVYYPQQDSFRQGKIQILLSGKYDADLVKNDTIWYMRLDGRLHHLDNPTLYPATLYPRISAAYPFHWKGKGEMSQEELAQLRVWVRQCHEQGQTLRFWGMPNREAVWELMLEEGVDWLNIDDLEYFEAFWKSQ